MPGQQSGGQLPPKPSQAEGDRETVEQDLRQQGQGPEGQGRQERGGGAPPPPEQTAAFDPLSKPSQAEGDRETVEADLRLQQGKEER